MDNKTVLISLNAKTYATFYKLGIFFCFLRIHLLTDNNNNNNVSLKIAILSRMNLLFRVAHSKKP